MKVSKWAMLIALAGGMSAATAMAQYGQRQPRVAQTGIEYGSYYQASAQMPAGSPSDMAPADAPMEAAPVAAAPAAGCTDGCTTGACTTDPGCAATCTNGACDPGCGADAACGCDNGCGSDCEECKLECPEPCEPWRLFGHCNECNCNGRVIKGWINGGIFGNADTPPSRFNGPTTFYDRDGEASLNQLYLLVERALDTSEGPSWGYRLDVLYGTDYRFNISRGLTANDNWTAKAPSSRFYGLDIPQAYVEAGANKWSVKFGHFYTLIGYEVVTAPDNFFATHAYTMQYGEPFTHTGGLVTYKANDQLTLTGGITTGWDNFENVYDELSFLGMVSFAASDGNSKLTYATHVGEEEETFGTVFPTSTRFIQSVVYTRNLTDRLSYVFQSDYGVQENALGSGEDAEWYGVNQYLFYKINCCWTAGIRGEWFRDDDGYRVAPAGDYADLGFSNNPASAGGFAGNFYEISMGLNYKPLSRPNLTVRPEVRYDWYDGPANGLGNDPFDDGASDDQLLYGFDVIYLY